MQGRTGAMLVLGVLAIGALLTAGCGGGSRGPVIIQQAPAGQDAPAPAAPVPSTPVTTSVTGALPGTTRLGAVVNGALGTQLDQLVATRMASEGAFTGSVLVAKGGQVLLNKGYGLADAARNLPVSPDAVWDWASVSKQFTSAAILKLRMQGQLGIDDPLSKFFPGAPADKQAITLRQLMSHTSGLQDDYTTANPGDGSRDAVMAGFLALPLSSPVGSKFSYNNANYFLLAAVVEKASGQAFEDYVTANLFRPAAMTEACFTGQSALDLSRVPRENRGTGNQYTEGETLGWGSKGATGAWASLGEMLAWDKALRGNTILDEAAKAELYKVVRDGYALGWFVDQDATGAIYRHGGATGQFNVTNYVRGATSQVVVCVACSYQSQAMDQLSAELYAAAAK